MSDGALFDGYDVVVCEQCGFSFADNLPSQVAFDEYYREMSKYEHQDQGGKQTDFDRHRYSVTARFIERFLPYREARILDIGCATGGLLSELKEKGHENVLGLDPSPVCASIAKELYGVPVLTGPLSDISPDLGSFDFIILCAVLEHLPHLRTALSQIRAVLSSKGMVYVEVPDVTRFSDSCDAPFQEFSIEHINFFSPISLSNLLTNCGFAQISIEQTAVEQIPGKITYDIKAVFQKSDCVRQPGAIPDGLSEPSLADYISRSSDVGRHIHVIVDSLVDSRRSIIVWGVGTHTQHLLAASSLAKANIVAFVDSNPRYQGKQLNGIPIIAPAYVKDKSEPILISSRDFQQEIVKMIRDELNCDNELILLYEL